MVRCSTIMKWWLYSIIIKGCIIPQIDCCHTHVCLICLLVHRLCCCCCCCSCSCCVVLFFWTCTPIHHPLVSSIIVVYGGSMYMYGLLLQIAVQFSTLFSEHPNHCYPLQCQRTPHMITCCYHWYTNELHRLVLGLGHIDWPCLLQKCPLLSLIQLWISQSMYP